MNALGIRKATLAGHSMGSFIAHQFAVMYPHRLDRLVLIGSAPTVAGNRTALDLKTKTVDRLVDPISPDFVREFTESGFIRRVPQEYLDARVEETLKVPATVWKQALDGLLAEDHSAQLCHIRARTAIFYGDQDGFSYPRKSKSCTTSFGGRSSSPTTRRGTNYTVKCHDAWSTI